MLIFCGEIGGSVWCYMLRDDLGTKIEDEINKWVTEKYQDDASIQLAVDNIQTYVSTWTLNTRIEIPFTFS